MNDTCNIAHTTSQIDTDIATKHCQGGPSSFDGNGIGIWSKLQIESNNNRKQSRKPIRYFHTGIVRLFTRRNFEYSHIEDYFFGRRRALNGESSESRLGHLPLNQFNMILSSLVSHLWCTKMIYRDECVFQILLPSSMMFGDVIRILSRSMVTSCVYYASIWFVRKLAIKTMVTLCVYYVSNLFLRKLAIKTTFLHCNTHYYSFRSSPSAASHISQIQSNHTNKN